MSKRQKLSYAEFRDADRALNRMQWTGIGMMAVGFVPAMFGITQTFSELVQSLLFLTLIAGVIVVIVAVARKILLVREYPRFTNRVRRERGIRSSGSGSGSWTGGGDSSGSWDSGGGDGGGGGGGD